MPTYTIILQEKGSAKAKKNVDNVNKSLGGLAKKAGIAAAGFVAVNKVFDGLNQSVQAAGKFEGVSTGFDNLRKSSGMSAAAFSKFNKALDGTATSTELMTMANNAMLLGITDSEDQMAKMFDTAQRLAKAVGEDAAFGVNSLVTGIGRQSKLMLDNLGIMVDTQKAYEDYAESIGLTASALDDEQKKTAFTNAALAEAEKLVNKLGAEQLTTTDYINQAKTAMNDLQIVIGKALSPAVKFLAGAFKTASGWAGKFIRGLTETSLETTIREMKELGMETSELNLILAETQALDLQIEAQKKGVRDIKVVQSEITEEMELQKSKLKEREEFEEKLNELGIAGLDLQNLWQKANNSAYDTHKGIHALELRTLFRTQQRLEKESEGSSNKLGALNQEVLLIQSVEGATKKVESIEENIARIKEDERKKAAAELSAILDPQPTQTLPGADDVAAMEKAEFTIRDFYLGEFEKQQLAKEEILIKAGVNIAEIREMQGQELDDWNAEQDQAEAERNITASSDAELKLEEFKLSLNDRITALRDAGVEEVDIEEWKTEQIKKWQKQDLQNRLQVAGKLMGSLGALNSAAKGSALVTARLQQAQAVINGVSSVQGALAPPPVGYGYTPLGIAASIAAGAAAAANVIEIENAMKSFATGGSFVTSGSEAIMVGDNPSGRELVNVTPLDAAGEPTGGGGMINVNITGNVMSENYTEDIIIPHIKEALRRGEAIS